MKSGQAKIVNREPKGGKVQKKNAVFVQKEKCDDRNGLLSSRIGRRVNQRTLSGEVHRGGT